MKICVFGAGAVGAVIAAGLSRAGHDISVVARGAHLTAIREHGLRILSGGSESTARIAAESDPARPDASG